MLTRRTFGMMLAVLPCAVATSGPVTAESYPTRPIKLIVPQAAGGPTDSLARLIAQQLSAALDEPVVVDNRPGGGLMIGTRAAAAADPDGYTLLFAPPGPLTVSPAISRDLGYDPLKSFVPVALLARSPQIFWSLLLRSPRSRFMSWSLMRKRTPVSSILAFPASAPSPI